MPAAAPYSDMVRFVLQLGVLIFLTRVGGEWIRRWFRLPNVLGELLIGVIIGPYALGQFAWPFFGHLFCLAPNGHAILPEIQAIATLASIVLLFLSGLETDLSTFLRYSVVGTLVGLGGVLASFFLGAGCAVWFLGYGWMHPVSLFLGAAACATSVGISARILAERHKMDAPEGTTIMAAAVFDDVLGIIVLAIVSGMVAADHANSGAIAWTTIAWIAAKAFGFWLGATVLGLLLARKFTSILKYFKTPSAMAALAFGAALLLAGISEMAGLAMIIGAYIMGLSLSRTDLVQVIQREIEGVHNLLVPVFFATMGMMVDLHTIPSVWKVGLLYTGFCVLSKLLGCGLPAWFAGFNRQGALRVGLGMLPRGEVALIIANIGIMTGAFGNDIFGIVIIMTLGTTLIGPLLMSGAFENPISGLRHPEKAAAQDLVNTLEIQLPSADLVDFLRLRIVRGFRQEDFYVYRFAPDVAIYAIRKDDIVLTLDAEGNCISIRTPKKNEALARMMMAEQMLTLRDLVTSLQDASVHHAVEANLLTGVFADQKNDTSATAPKKNDKA